MTQEDEDYVADFSRRWKEMSGYVYPQYEFLAREDPEFAEAFYSMMSAWRREYAMPLQYKEMLILMGSSIKMQEFAVKTHMRKAFELGATKQEMLELVEVVLLSGGGAAMVIALRVLMELVGEDVDTSGPAWDAGNVEGAAGHS